MKKLLALLLALIMALALCGCGASAPGNASTEMFWNEETEIPNILSIVPTGMSFSAKYRLNDSTYISPPDGYICINLSLRVKNIAKGELFADVLTSRVIYGDGYEFSGTMKVRGITLQPLADAESIGFYYFVPKEAYYNVEEPLTFVLEWFDGTDSDQYTLPVRPLNEEQKDKACAEIEQCIQDGQYESVLVLLENWRFFDRYQVVSGEEFAAFLADGPVIVQDHFNDLDNRAFNGQFEDVTFNEEGYGMPDEDPTPWRIEGDAFVFQWSGDDYACQVYKLCDNTYILVCDGLPVRMICRN